MQSEKQADTAETGQGAEETVGPHLGPEPPDGGRPALRPVPSLRCSGLRSTAWFRLKYSVKRAGPSPDHHSPDFHPGRRNEVRGMVVRGMEIASLGREILMRRPCRLPAGVLAHGQRLPEAETLGAGWPRAAGPAGRQSLPVGLPWLVGSIPARRAAHLQPGLPLAVRPALRDRSCPRPGNIWLASARDDFAPQEGLRPPRGAF